MDNNSRITINGHNHPLTTPLPLIEILRQFKIDSRFVAVAVNGEVLPRSSMEPCIVQAGDVIEVMRATAGG